MKWIFDLSNWSVQCYWFRWIDNNRKKGRNLIKWILIFCSCEKTTRSNWVYRFDRYSMFFNRISCRLSNLKVCAVSVVADCVTLLCLNVNTIEQSATHFHSTPIIHQAPHFPYFLFFIVDGFSFCFFFLVVAE